jgi:hypothetical protein
VAEKERQMHGEIKGSQKALQKQQYKTNQK